MAKKATAGDDARNIPPDVRNQVLHEAGFKCASPTCRHPLTLDVHHLLYVSEGGTADAANLLPLCPNCHTGHHRADTPPTSSLRAWKLLLLTLNEAFDRRSVDMLLAIDKIGQVRWITGDGLHSYAPLVASNLILLNEEWHESGGGGGLGGQFVKRYTAALTERGKQFVEAWKKGDQQAAVTITPAS